MFRRTIIPSLVIALVLPARAALDLTPTERTFIGQGVPYRQLLFKDDKRTFSMDLPAGWTFRGGATRLQLTPPDKNFADGVIEVMPLPAPQLMDDAAMHRIEQQALAAVPPGSQKILVTERNRNAVVLGGNESFEVVLSYQALGQTFWRSTVVVNFPESLLLFRLTAPKADFGSLNEAFRRSLLSWQLARPIASTR